MLDFYRAEGSAFPLLVDFHRTLPAQALALPAILLLAPLSYLVVRITPPAYPWYTETYEPVFKCKYINETGQVIGGRVDRYIENGVPCGTGGIP